MNLLIESAGQPDLTKTKEEFEALLRRVLPDTTVDLFLLNLISTGFASFSRFNTTVYVTVIPEETPA